MAKEKHYNWQNLFLEESSPFCGYVYSINDAKTIINLYEIEMNEKFVAPYSRHNKFGETDIRRNNHNVYWDIHQRPTNEPDGKPVIFFSPSDENIPYIHANNRDLFCQYGQDKQVAKKIKYRKNICKNEDRLKVKNMRGSVNIISKKCGCPSMIKMKEIVLFPTFKLPSLSEWKCRVAAKSLKDDVKQGKELETERRIYIRLPEVSSHCNHPNRDSNKKISCMYAALVDRPGSADRVYIGEMARSEPCKDTVLIKVAASTVNRDDTLQRQGLLRPLPLASRALGIEVSGTVLKAGPKCKINWKTGTKVMACCNGGGNGEYVCVSEDLIMRVPSHMDFCAAAAIPQAWLMAFDILHNVGNLKAGDFILIHAGASGVGTAAIQLANLAGARAIVTTSCSEKIELCKTLGALDAFNYRSEAFADSVLQLTKGKGVNLILDCVGETHWEHNARVIATEGCWVVYGILSGSNVNGSLFETIMNKRITIKGVKLRERTHKYKAELTSAFCKRILPHFSPTSTVHLTPIVNKIFPLAKIKEAHRYVESNQSIGKVVLDIQGEDNFEMLINQDLEAAESIKAITEPQGDHDCAEPVRDDQLSNDSISNLTSDELRSAGKEQDKTSPVTIELTKPQNQSQDIERNDCTTQELVCNEPFQNAEVIIYESEQSCRNSEVVLEETEVETSDSTEVVLKQTALQTLNEEADLNQPEFKPSSNVEVQQNEPQTHNAEHSNVGNKTENVLYVIVDNSEADLTDSLIEVL